jgi:hypothetical protein
MSLKRLLCLSKPEVESDDPVMHDLSSTRYREGEKEVCQAEDEDEMQQRLSDMRRQISDAKLDW